MVMKRAWFVSATRLLWERLSGYRPCNNSTAWSNTANGSAAL